jgi:hypothetical protein
MPERRVRRIPIPADQLQVLTAAAELLTPNTVAENPGRRPLFQYASWQDEGWAFWRSSGEYNFGVTWLSNTISRIRLIAAEMGAPGDEPTALPADHEASLLVASIGGNISGQAALLGSLTTHLSVPGDSWVVVEQKPNKQLDWKVYSAKTIREPKKLEAPFQVQVNAKQWRPLSNNTITFRVWRPDEEYHWRAFSFTEPALPILRALDLYNRRIIATLVSRIAMNGFLTVPAEMTFQSRPEFKDAPDPFIAEMVEHASYAIKNPGTASAAIPFPVRIPAQYIEGFKHIALENGVDPKLIEARDSEIKRLATTMHMPGEVLLGMGDTSHWNAWQISDEAIKTFVAPIVEIEVGAFTDQYLLPGLTAMGKPLVGPHGRPIVCWYDPSEITVKPDKTQAVKDGYDRGEVSGKALRRELGLEEADKPTKSELRDWTLKRLVQAPQTAVQAAKELAGVDLTPPAPTQPELPFDETGDQPADNVTADQTRTAPTMADNRDQPPPVTASSWSTLNVNGHRPPVRV